MGWPMGLELYSCPYILVCPLDLYKNLRPQKDTDSPKTDPITEHL